MTPNIDGFEIGELIGRGADSAVYSAVQPAFGRSVAIKIVDIDPRDEELMRRFHRECALIGRLSSHPNVVTVHSTGTADDGRPYFAMEFCPLGSLRDHLDAEGPTSAGRATAIGIELAGALETAHLEGMLHRDLKPENVLIGADDTVKVADFGIATLALRVGDTSRAAMTPVHAAPELFDGRRASIQSDVYSLGSTLSTLLTGRPPITLEPDAPESFYARAASAPRPALPPEVPHGLASLIGEMLDVDPGRRPDSMAEVGHRLQELQRDADQTVTALTVIQPGEPILEATRPTSTVTEPLAPHGRRANRRGLAATAIGLAVVAGAFVGGRTTASRSTTDDAAPRSSGASASPSSDAIIRRAMTRVDIDWASTRPTGDSANPLLIVHDGARSAAGSTALSLATDLRPMLDPRTAATPLVARGPIGQWPVLEPYPFPIVFATNFVNPTASTSGKCRGFKSLPLYFVDARSLVMDRSGLILVTEFGSPADAAEYFAGMALLMGVDTECSGFDKAGWPVDRAKIRVTRNDLGFATPEGIDELASGTTPDEAFAVIVRRGDVVIWGRQQVDGRSDGRGALQPWVDAFAATARAHVRQ